MVQIATKKTGICNCEICKYRGHDNKCKFGLRDIGCYMEYRIAKEMSGQFVKAFEKGIGVVQ